jgi:hypothetical protein
MGIELGIGESLIVKAIAESTGRTGAKIKEDFKKEGDLGKVAMVSYRLPTQGVTARAHSADVPEYSTHHVQAETAYSPLRLPEPYRNRQSHREFCTFFFQ